MSHGGKGLILVDPYRKLIAQYAVGYEGPLFPQQWPQEIANTFQAIYDISRIGHEEYISAADPDDSRTSEIISRLNKLLDLANDCREKMANESEWRESIESRIFSVLTSDDTVW
jgi:hypothetical protein